MRDSGKLVLLLPTDVIDPLKDFGGKHFHGYM